MHQPNDRWHGCFKSLNEAIAFGSLLPNRQLKLCGVCLKKNYGRYINWIAHSYNSALEIAAKMCFNELQPFFSNTEVKKVMAQIFSDRHLPVWFIDYTNNL